MNYLASALAKGMRFPSSKGMLTLEQVFGLKLVMTDPNNELRNMITTAYEQYKPETKSDLDFLKPVKSAVATEDEIRFNVLKEVYQFKVNEIEAASKKAEVQKEIKFLEEQLLKKQQAETEKSFEGQTSADILNKIKALKESL